MAVEMLPYATPGQPSSPAVVQRRPPLTPEQRRLRVRLLARTGWIFLLLGIPTFWTLYVGDNRWRVQFHHGVDLPPSARAFQCSGHTAIFDILGGQSSARFTIDAADLRQFLSQFRLGLPMPQPSGGYPTFAAPSQPIPAKGHIGGPSPTGRDHYGLRWETSSDGVLIELHTGWN